jgi:hypothetical protein
MEGLGLVRTAKKIAAGLWHTRDSAMIMEKDMFHITKRSNGNVS